MCIFCIQEVNGQLYKTKHIFTCETQAKKLCELLENMAACPQDCVSLIGGCMTTNTVEGFHGLALMYRDKKTDLGHTRYVCKTNMVICLKVRCCNNMNTVQCTYTYMNAESQSHMEPAMLHQHGG